MRRQGVEFHTNLFTKVLCPFPPCRPFHIWSGANVGQGRGTKQDFRVDQQGRDQVGRPFVIHLGNPFSIVYYQEFL